MDARKKKKGYQKKGRSMKRSTADTSKNQRQRCGSAQSRLSHYRPRFRGAERAPTGSGKKTNGSEKLMTGTHRWEQINRKLEVTTQISTIQGSFGRFRFGTAT